MNDPVLLTTARGSGNDAVAIVTPIYYVIAGAPRTGSSLLAEALAATGLAGTPDEFFDIHAVNEKNFADRYRIPPGANYIDHIEAATRAANGAFGFKLHWHQLAAISRRLSEARPGAEPPVKRPAIEMIRERFPGIRFIWLARKNKVAQAISYYRANETNIWRVWTDNRPSVPPSGKNSVYDRAEIERFLRLVNKMDAGWLRFFREHKIRTLLIFYEEFIQSYEETVHRALRFLDLPTDSLQLPPPALQRLANSESEEWEQRFREEMSWATVRQRVKAPAATLPARPTVAAAPAVAKPAPAPAQATLPLIAYAVGSTAKTDLARGSPTRAWMDATPQHFAYRCLPMVIANQWGWVFATRHRVEAVWDGSRQPAGLVVTSSADENSASACSHFGSGVLTFKLGFLFQTPPGFNLHVRGPANWPKDGIYPLEGVVESDWIESTFTMNWKMTRPNHKVVFEAGEPIAMISPVRRGQLEQFAPIIRPLAQNKELAAKYREWAKSRDTFNADLKVTGSDATKTGWQKDYMRGRTVAGGSAPEHQTGLELKDFVEER